MKYGVPVALATDDEGVSRSDMTHEYLRAVETYGLSYGDLKRMARESLEHSFIPGWQPVERRTRVASGGAAATVIKLPASTFRGTCQKLIGGSERARVQWQLERAFVEFEKAF